MLNTFPMYLIPVLLLLTPKYTIRATVITDVMCENGYYTLLTDELINKNDLDIYKYTNLIAFEKKISQCKERKHLSICISVHK